MESSKVNMFILQSGNLFPKVHQDTIKELLLLADDDKAILLNAVNFKRPKILGVVSVCLGWLGIDRFLASDYGMGILKMFTFGGFFMLAIYDWLFISRRVKQKNFDILTSML